MSKEYNTLVFINMYGYVLSYNGILEVLFHVLYLYNLCVCFIVFVYLLKDNKWNI